VQAQCARVNLGVFWLFGVRVIFTGEIQESATLYSHGKKIPPLKRAYFYMEERLKNHMLMLYKSVFTNSTVLTSHNTLLRGNVSL